MKYLKLVFLTVFIIIFSSNAFALNLEVDSDLNDFAEENLLGENQTQNLRNPFFEKKEAGENPEAEEELELEDGFEADPSLNSAAETDDQRTETIKDVESEPEIIINGVISASNSRLALLVSYQQEKHLLKIGDSLDDYRLTAYKNGEATFEKNGEEFEIAY
ncbi:MAG: hypothetical protein ACOCXB_01635 [Halanaerobium sp.]